MTGLLAGQVAVVTGAARGQGRSHALALAKKRGLPLEWPQGVLFVPAECPDLSKR